jgi:hypothetical protein
MVPSPLRRASRAVYCRICPLLPCGVALEALGIRKAGQLRRTVAITGLAVVYFISAAGMFLFLVTDFQGVVPNGLRVVFALVALLQCALGRGLLKMQNWARVTTVILSACVAFPSVMQIIISFSDLNVFRLLLNLSFVTILGMVIWYLLLPETRQLFEATPTKLNLK